MTKRVSGPIRTKKAAERWNLEGGTRGLLEEGQCKAQAAGQIFCKPAQRFTAGSGAYKHRCGTKERRVRIAKRPQCITQASVLVFFAWGGQMGGYARHNFSTLHQLINIQFTQRLCA